MSSSLSGSSEENCPGDREVGRSAKGSAWLDEEGAIE